MLLPLLWLLSISATLIGPLVFPHLYTALVLAYSMFFAYVTVRLAHAFRGVSNRVIQWHAQKAVDLEMGALQCDHLIVIPNYCESKATLRRTLGALSKHTHARARYLVCLAMEESESGAPQKAAELELEFGDQFARFLHTTHPANRPKEVPGKGSNLNWAVRVIGKDILSASTTQVLITVLDADSILGEHYFRYIDGDFIGRTEKNPIMYAPPILFNQNSNHIPSIVRAIDIQWACFGAATMEIWPGFGFPTSVYSLPLRFVTSPEIQYWDTGSDAMAEDIHMYLKCFFKTDGALRTHIVPHPASQSNVHAPSYVGMLTERWKQALRHAAGVSDSVYALARDSFPPNSVYVLILLYMAHFYPLANVGLLISCWYAPIVQPLYADGFSVVSWWLIWLILSVSNSIAGIVMALSYHRMHNECSLRPEHHSTVSFYVDAIVLPVSVCFFLLVPVARAICMHFTGKRDLYHTAGKPE